MYGIQLYTIAPNFFLFANKYLTGKNLPVLSNLLAHGLHQRTARVSPATGYTLNEQQNGSQLMYGTAAAAWLLKGLLLLLV